MDMIYVAIIIGVFAGLIHQVIDRGKKNTGYALLRGAIVGGVTALLTIWAMPEQTIQNMGSSIYPALFTASYMADNIVLNSSERAKMINQIKTEEKDVEHQVIHEAENQIEDEIGKI